MSGRPPVPRGPTQVRALIRARRLLNLVNLSTPAGLLLARFGNATVRPGPHGILLATGYRAAFPAPRAPAVTIGDVILLRLEEDALGGRPQLLAHEARHSIQYACCLGLFGFVPAYLLASAWSWLRVRDFALRNVFEVRAGLADGGYPDG